MLTAEQDFYIAAISPQKPQDKSDLLFMLRDNMPATEDIEMRALAESCITALLQMRDDDYRNHKFPPARE